MVIETLLGMWEGSKNTMSERLPCEQAKGGLVNEGQAISSSLATSEIESSTLVGEGEGVRSVNQGEPLMQEYRENERNAGTEDIRMDIASESMIVKDADKEMLYQQISEADIPPSSLDAEAFTHHIPAYQILASQGNEEAKRSLNLVKGFEHQTQWKNKNKKINFETPPQDPCKNMIFNLKKDDLP